MCLLFKSRIGLTRRSMRPPCGRHFVCAACRRLSSFVSRRREKTRAACLNSDRLARIATRRCLPMRLKHASALTSAHFARRVSKTSWKMYARTAAVDLFQDLSDRRRTGKATTSLVRTQRAQKFGIGRLTRKFMRGSQPQSSPYHLTSDRCEDD